MDQILTMNGVQIASCIIKCDFREICPSSRFDGYTNHAKKRKKHPDKKYTECFLFDPFKNEVGAAIRYVNASPKCVELFDHLKSENSDAKERSLAMLCFIIKKCNIRTVEFFIAEHIFSNMCEDMYKLFSVSDVAVHYLLEILIKSIKILPKNSLKSLIRSTDFYKVICKRSTSESKCTGSSVLTLYSEVVNKGLIRDIGIIDSSFTEMLDEETNLCHIKGRQQLSIILLLGLKGFNILGNKNAIRFIFDHLKQGDLLETICTIHLFISIMSMVLNKHCNTSSLDLGKSKRCGIPEFVISSTATSLSHISSQITKALSFGTSNIVRLNGLLFEVSREFLGIVRTYCDVAIFADILLKFEITNLSAADMVFDILAEDNAVGRIYIQNVNCKYNGIMEYMVLLRFLNKWFVHLSTCNVEESEILLYIPSFLNKNFLTNGLLSGSDYSVLRGTLRLICSIIDFGNRLNISKGGGFRFGEGSRTVGQFCEILPEFKTIINSKSVIYKNQKVKASNDVSINIKSGKRSMISNDLDKILDDNSGYMILGIDKSDFILTDWLTCLYKFSSFIRASDLKDMYDPCKLLKEPTIAENCDFISSLFRKGFKMGTKVDKKLLERIKLDMALVDCFFYLGIGDVTAGLVFGKVQFAVFQYIFFRFVELNTAVAPFPILFDEYLKKCKYYVSQVLEASDFFTNPIEFWIMPISNIDESYIFLFLFRFCVEKPLDVSLGVLSTDCSDRNSRRFTCSSCHLKEHFRGPPFLKLSLDLLVHINQKTEDDFVCVNCNVGFLNLIRMAKKRYTDMDLNRSINYILKICQNLQCNTMKSQVHTILKSLDMHVNIFPNDVGLNEEDDHGVQSVPSTSKTPEKDQLIDIEVVDTHLIIYLSLVKSVTNFDTEELTKTEKCSIIIDVISLKFSHDAHLEERLRKKWNRQIYTDFISRCLSLTISNLFTHLFLLSTSLLDNVDISQIESDVFSRLAALTSSKETETMWTQLLYIQRRIMPESEFKLETELKESFERSIFGLRRNFSSWSEEEINITLVSLYRISEVLSKEINASELFSEIVKCFKKVDECGSCTNLLDCKYVTIVHLLEIATNLLNIFCDTEKCIKTLRSKRILRLAKIVCGINSKDYFIGDVIENRLLDSYLRFILALLNNISLKGGETLLKKILKKKSMYRLLTMLASCYRCSFTQVDILLKNVIVKLVDLISNSVEDRKSAILRLPMFQDFSCIEKVHVGSEGSSDPKWMDITLPRNHGWKCNWLYMTDGIAMRSEKSNWLCLNNKRVSLTLSKYPRDEDRHEISGLRESFLDMSILYPPPVNANLGKSDELFGSIIRLNKTLGSSNRCLQNLIVGDPYIYDVEYLVPYLTGRLCLMLYNQLYLYNTEFSHVFNELGLDSTDDTHCEPIRFSRTLKREDAKSAAKRLYNQCRERSFTLNLGADFSVHSVESAALNGALELCILGLLNCRVKKMSIKALGLFIRILRNIMDSEMLRHLSNDDRVIFRFRNLKVLPQIHSLLFFLQRCYLTSDGSYPALHVIFASQALIKAVKVENPLYRLTNRFLLLRYSYNLEKIPLFYDSFMAQKSNEKPVFLSFILSVLGSSARFVDCEVLSGKHIFQQLMSLAMVETTPQEHIIQIIAIFFNAIALGNVKIQNLCSLGIFNWISHLSVFLESDETKEVIDIIWNTARMCALTLLMRELTFLISNCYSNGDPEALSGCDHDHSSNPAPLNFVDSLNLMLPAFEALCDLADGWNNIIKRIPSDELTGFRMRGYGRYIAMLDESLDKLSNSVNIAAKTLEDFQLFDLTRILARHVKIAMDNVITTIKTKRKVTI